MIVALSAYKNSGKDTAADYLIKNYDFVRVAFADPLKDSVAEMFGISRDSLDNPALKESPLLNFPVKPQDPYSKMIANFLVKEFRTKEGKVSQVFFTTVNQGLVQDANGKPNYEDLFWTPRALAILHGSTMRSVDSAHWVKQALVKAGLQTKNVVITDLRYKSEVNQLREAFGSKLTTARINRFDSSPSSDPSELDLQGYSHDFEIENKGTLEDFYANVDAILAGFEK